MDAARRVNPASLLEVFVFLQLLDFLTTATGLKWGAQEVNPFIVQMMGFGTIQGLIACKVAILIMALAVLWHGRTRVILALNYIFAAIVVWNLTQLLKLPVA